MMLCILMGVFGIGVILIGYQPATIGRIATIALLFVGAAASGYFSYRNAG